MCYPSTSHRITKYPTSSAPRRPTSDSFDNNDGQSQNKKKCHRNNDHSPRYEQSEKQQHLPTLVPPHLQQNNFNMNNIPSSIQVAINEIDPTKSTIKKLKLSNLIYYQIGFLW
jgi:hypothetical protein